MTTKTKAPKTPETTPAPPAQAATEQPGRAVVVTTKDRGLFFGYVADESKLPAQVTLTQMRNCIAWSMAVKGFVGLASSGPLQGSRVGPAAARATLFDVTSLLDATPDAVTAWEKAPWA